MEYNAFVKTYCRWVKAEEGERLSLREKSDNDCIFWDQGCTVYNARPLQCRTFPFWQSILRSPSAWKIASSACPGINSGALHKREEIEAALTRRSDESLITRKAGVQ
jgi:Fe-S-cluster containining protein